MSRSRVFIPSTLEELAAFREAREVGPAPFTAHCAELLRIEHPGADDEELEYAAMTAASVDSLQRIRPGGQPVRVVIAADVPTYTEDGPAPSEMTVTANVPWTDVASVHVDTADAEGAVSAALESPGDTPALERLLEHELAWFATQEIDDLIAARSGTEQ